MPWVRFSQDFDYVPPERRGLATIAYKAGSKCNVTRRCAGMAIAGGKAVKISAVEQMGERSI